MYICPICKNCRHKKNVDLQFRMQHCSKKYQDCDIFKKRKDANDLQPIPRYDYKD